MFLLSAIGLGFLGSLHCIGMCGPISLALSSKAKGKEFWLSRSLYNLGRTTAYILLGVVFGIFGQSLALAGIQQSLSIAVGVIWILALLIFPNWESRLISFPLFKKALVSIKRGLSNILQKQSTHLMYNAGFLNGFLPCGLVYIALSGSLASQSLTESVGFMALFGLGTFPAMFAVAFLSRTKFRLKGYVKPVLYTASFVFALLLILRGLNLGIPYLSPELTTHAELICH